MGKPIPEIRSELYKLANDPRLPSLVKRKLRQLADDTFRSSPVRKTRAKNRKMTAKIAAEVRQYARANPTLSMTEIGLVFKINSGRVSEAMNRKI